MEPTHAPPGRLLCRRLLSSGLGCGSEKINGPSFESLVGTWSLSTVNGAALPFTFQAANPKTEILSDQFVTRADGTFIESTDIRFTDATGPSVETFPDSGLWALNGTAIFLQFSDGSTATGTAASDALTFAGGGFSQVYRKQ